MDASSKPIPCSPVTQDPSGTSTSSIDALPGDWRFVKELCQPRPMRLGVDVNREAGKDEVDLRQGLRYAGGLTDEQELLVTAEADIQRLLDESGLYRVDGLPVSVGQSCGLESETFVLTLERDRIHLDVADVEGARRGLYHLEDLLAGMNGSSLHVGVTTHRSWVEDRISRCFFGPIKRPPFYRDELANDVDYYPDAYLSRLASEGINGLWLTVAFSDLCTTTISKPGPDAAARLAKLRATVRKCARYGIRIWVFSIEPVAMTQDHPLLKAHPELAGAVEGSQVCLCPRSSTAQRYLYECTNDLFSQVPGLGGLINISHGERRTSCISTLDSRADSSIACKACRALPIWRAMHDTLAPMRQGMTAANPQARFISWMYMPTVGPCAQWVKDCASHMPPGVILQCNFDSNVQVFQAGKIRSGGDYWLSAAGPSPEFNQLSKLAREAGTPTSAKLQVVSSHEVATVPMVPVPGLVYRKYHAMLQLGCSAAMMCWYFGNYPGLMNKAACMAGWESGDEEDEQAFLERLARRYWGEHAPDVARAWSGLAQAYEHFPLTNFFQYYGPMHTGPTWPLHLVPVMKPLARTWMPHDEPSGDVIGECLGGFTLDEAIELCDRLADGWQENAAPFKQIEVQYLNQPDRLRDIRIVHALELQFDSGRNILRFYQLRQRLATAEPADRPGLLMQIRRLVEKEITNSQKLLRLCELESSLGFHSESESYKYNPDLLQQRIDQLHQLLSQELPVIEKWPADQSWPARRPARTTVHTDGSWTHDQRLRWQIHFNADALHVRFICDATGLDISVIYLWLLDNLGTQSPQLIRIQRDDRHPHTHEAKIELTQLETGSRDIWQADVAVAVPPDVIRQGLEPVWISVLHNYQNKQGGFDYSLWPQPDGQTVCRLNLLRFVPGSAASLKYTNHPQSTE